MGTTLRNLGKISSGELTLSFWQKTSLLLQVQLFVYVIIYVSKVVVLFALFGYFYILSKKVKDKQVRQQLTDIDGSFTEVTVES